MKEKALAYENSAQKARKEAAVKTVSREALWLEDWERLVGKIEAGCSAEEAIHAELLGRMIRIENLMENVLRRLRMMS